MPESKTYTSEQLERTLRKMPLVFTEEILPAHPATDPDTGEEYVQAEQMEVVADFRIRMPLRMGTGGRRTVGEKRAIMRRHLEEYMWRTLFDYVTGEKEWGE